MHSRGQASIRRGPGVQRLTRRVARYECDVAVLTKHHRLVRYEVDHPSAAVAGDIAYPVAARAEDLHRSPRFSFLASSAARCSALALV